MLQPHPSRARRTFISPCLNQALQPSRAEARALEGGGLAAGLRWRCESCRAPLPEQRCQNPLPRRLLRQVVPSGCGRWGDVFFPPPNSPFANHAPAERDSCPVESTALPSQAPRAQRSWKHGFINPRNANTRSQKKQSSFSFLFLALTPKMCVFRGRGAALFQILPAGTSRCETNPRTLDPSHDSRKRSFTKPLVPVTLGKIQGYGAGRPARERHPLWNRHSPARALLPLGSAQPTGPGRERKTSGWPENLHRRAKPKAWLAREGEIR